MNCSKAHQSLADEILSAGIDADRIEAIEWEETHLIDHI